MFGVFLAVGLVICFLGRRLFKPVLFVAGLLATVFIIILIFYSTFLKSTTKVWIGWVVLAGAIIIGILIGALFVKCAKLGAFVLAGWGGFCLGLLIYNAFLYKMNSQIGFWFFTIGVGLVLGVLTIFFFDHIIINSTSFFGAFIAVYGIGLVAGHYTNPFTIVELIDRGEITSVDAIFYAYMGGTLVLYIIGAIV